MADFPYNPNHAIATCGDCGGELVFNVPRLGPNGGYVHKATGRFECASSPEKNQAAVALGRLGGLKGGARRAELLTPARRREIAKRAAQARWAKQV